MGEMITLTAEDGHKLAGYRATPSGKPRGEHAHENPRCPVLRHWGETDQSILPDHWKKLSTAHPEVPTHVYPAGHGFSCDARGSYHEPSAKLARTRTLDFLRQHLG